MPCASASKPRRIDPEIPPTLSAIKRRPCNAPSRMYSAKSAMEKMNSPTCRGVSSFDASQINPAFEDKWYTEARRMYPNRTAAQTAIRSVMASTLPMEQGLLEEDKYANQTKRTVEARGAIHVFFAERESRKVEGLPPGEANKISKAGVVGAGTMGGGIAIAFANAGIPVTLLDANEAGLAKGLATVDATFESMVKRGRIDAAEKMRRMSLIKGSLKYADLATADVVIEAVFESMDLKKKVFADMDARAALP